ncbi:ribulose-phosphate 3-epimerase [Saccharibacillus sp. CPCC 101409]|uniref:ribulose-phosphate 3-epimerase n=1 Tax=Saccharibacillus sp. CPCC 101409 TaxID=3058041 RepID=UPI0026729A88|nr:ribulose-phosphate 3-epimerase [Saccharibacillus sp. CPCC 101409]MDO3411535.1 ribulose-phosphate 3-epimerase [Saccharibacillus sp. CPCC 101409]
MMEKLLCPSMMCADFRSLEREMSELNASDIDIYHIDIMDGRFVPNFGMGMQDFEYIRAATQKPVDVHLMIDNPAEYVELFIEKGANIVYFHPEADLHPTRTIDRIRAAGARAGIALNPGTSIEAVKPLIGIVDYIMIMTVNPGFAGQKYLDFVNEKIEELAKLRENKGYAFEMMVDGAISPEKIQLLGALGVKGFVLGTSSLFGKGESYRDIAQRLKAL